MSTGKQWATVLFIMDSPNGMTRQEAVAQKARKMGTVRIVAVNGLEKQPGDMGYKGIQECSA